MELDRHFKARVQQHKQVRGTLVTEIAPMKRQKQFPLAVLTARKIESVAKVLNTRLSDASPFAKVYLGNPLAKYASRAM